MRISRLPKAVFRFSEKPVNVGFLGDIALYGNGLSTRAGNFGNHLIRTGLTGGVIDNNRSAFGSKMFGDGRPNAFGCTGDDRDFASERFVLCDHIF